MNTATVQSKATLVRTVTFNAIWDEEREVIPFRLEIYRSHDDSAFKLTCTVADGLTSGKFGDFRATQLITEVDESSGVVDIESAERYAFLVIQDWLDQFFWKS